MYDKVNTEGKKNESAKNEEVTQPQNEPQTEVYKSFRTKEEWQAEIDRIIGRRLGQEREKSQGSEIDSIYENWLNEAKELAQKDPDFDFAEMVKNPHFINSLKMGKSVFEAYQSAISVQNKKKNHPLENGAAATAAKIGRTDVSRMSDKEFDNLLEEVASGKTIK